MNKAPRGHQLLGVKHSGAPLPGGITPNATLEHSQDDFGEVLCLALLCASVLPYKRSKQKNAPVCFQSLAPDEPSPRTPEKAQR